MSFRYVCEWNALANNRRDKGQESVQKQSGYLHLTVYYQISDAPKDFDIYTSFKTSLVMNDQFKGDLQRVVSGKGTNGNLITMMLMNYKYSDSILFSKHSTNNDLMREDGWNEDVLCIDH